jgi:hypothetical protein
MNVRIGNEAAQFYFWEYINRIFCTVWDVLVWDVLSRVVVTFLGPNGTDFARCHLEAQKSLDF